MASTLTHIKRRTVQYLTESHIVGPTLADAVAFYRKVAHEGWTGTLSPWNDAHVTPTAAAERYRQTLERIAQESFDCQLSVKVHNLGYRFELLQPLLEYSAERNIFIQFDSFDLASADKTLALFEQACAQYNHVGYTLPSRWRRSLEDVERLLALHCPLRLVKGQWFDPQEPHRDARSGFLELTDCVAGRAVKVSVATHDGVLARAALTKLQHSGTPTEYEQMIGLPFQAERIAKPLGIPVRLYIPYGSPYLPYNGAQFWKQPRVAAWLVRDFVLGRDKKIKRLERVLLNRNGNHKSPSSIVVPEKTGLKELHHSDVETVSTLSGIDEFREGWNRLAEQFASPLLSHEWFATCAAAFCPPDRLNVHVLRSNGKVKAIAPTFTVRNLGVEQIEIIGSQPLMEPTSLLYDDHASFERLLNVLLERKKTIFLRRLSLPPSFSSIIPILAEKKSFFVIESKNYSPWLPITTTWEEFESRMKQHQRSNLRRVRRRLEERGPVTLEIHTDDSQNFRQALDEAFRIEHTGWKRKNKTSILSSEKGKKFFTEYALLLARRGLVRLFLLKVNDEGIAMMLAVEYGRRFWTLKVGYDESWAPYAPGKILHHETIRWAFEHRLEGYEFLGTTEPWIRTWTESTHAYSTYRLFPKSLNGVFCMAIEGSRVMLKRAADVALRVLLAIGSQLGLIISP